MPGSCEASSALLCSVPLSHNQQACVSSQSLSWPGSQMSTRVPGTHLKVHSTAAHLPTAWQEPCPYCKHSSAQLRTHPSLTCATACFSSVFPVCPGHGSTNTARPWYWPCTEQHPSTAPKPASSSLVSY